ncbi:hypothetical protein FACS1894191_4770 [Clostridia bacterium]|nr:hypothetical protein FACS1894191_4770 [Clostridia bacterium]
MQDYNRRNYNRGTHFSCTAKISADEKRWASAKVDDLSSGGLSLESKKDYNVGDSLWLDLHIEAFMISPFDAKVRGIIRRKQAFPDHMVYGIQFLDLRQELKIRIDESVRADRPVSGGAYEDD